MRIEALRPLKIKRPGGDMLLTPGEPVDFPDDEGQRLLERAGDKVRAIEDLLQIGMVIEWDSPLFGLLRGIALEITAQTVLVHHPLTEVDVHLPRTWVKEVRSE